MTLRERFNGCKNYLSVLLFDQDGVQTKKMLDNARDILTPHPLAKNLLNLAARMLVRTRISVRKAFTQDFVGLMDSSAPTGVSEVLLRATIDPLQRAATMIHEYRHVQQEVIEMKPRRVFRTLRDAVMHNRLVEADAYALEEVLMAEIINQRYHIEPKKEPLAQRLEEEFRASLLSLDNYDRHKVSLYYKFMMSPMESDMLSLDISKSRRILLAGTDVHDPVYMAGLSDRELETSLMRNVEKDVLLVIEAIDGYRASCAGMTSEEAEHRKKEIGTMVQDMVVRGKVLKKIERNPWIRPKPTPVASGRELSASAR